MKILIKGGRVVDPGNNLEEKLDVYLEAGRIVRLAKRIEKKGVKVVNAQGKLVLPGLIDLHTHLREPGHEEEETIATGTRAAACGGFTTLCVMPNTHPVTDNQTTVEFILLKAKNEGIVNICPIAAATKNLEGEELAEIGELKKAGVCAISDDGAPIMNSLVMRRVLEYAKMFDLPVIAHCEDRNLTQRGVINEGRISTLLGLRGMPSEAEEIMVARNIILARLTGGRLHIAHLSTRGAMELVRQAKKEGLRITAETAPHYFVLSEEEVVNFDPNTKINPPLRSKEDVKAIRKGLAEGVIDLIATDHAPHTEEEKNKEYALAPFGIIGLETAFPLTFTYLVEEKVLSLKEAVAKWTIAPARVAGLDRGTLSSGSVGDLVIIDPKKEKRVEKFYSKSKNSPFLGRKLRGFAEMTIVGGRIVMANGKIISS